jgi:L-fuconolactonase
MRIDAHQHFWQYNAARDSWITDDMSVIQRDFFPKDLESLLQHHNIDGCIAVQASQSEDENKFLLQLANENDFIKGVVGWVDLKVPDIQAQLQHYQQFPKLKGFRHVLQGEVDRAFMLQPSFMKGIGALKEYGYTYDILIYTDQLQFIPDFVSAFPGQKFVIDHLAKPGIKNKEINDWSKAMQAIAAHPNVWCKISGMVTEADWHHWKKEDFFPYLDVVVNAFGTDRIMFGSDWPVCLVAASYDKMIGIVQEYFQSFTTEEQLNFFGNNTATFYNLK